MCQCFGEQSPCPGPACLINIARLGPRPATDVLRSGLFSIQALFGERQIVTLCRRTGAGVKPTGAGFGPSQGYARPAR